MMYLKEASILVFAISTCVFCGVDLPDMVYTDDSISSTVVQQEMDTLRQQMVDLNASYVILNGYVVRLENEIGNIRSQVTAVSNLHSLIMRRFNETELQENDILTFEILTYGDGTDVSPPDESYLYNASWNAYVVPYDGQYRFGLLISIAATFQDGDFGFFVRDPEGTEIHLSEYDFKISPFVPERSTQRIILNLYLKAESRVFVKEISGGCTVEYAVFTCCREGNP